MPFHHRPITGDEPPSCENVGRCPPPRQGGRRAHHTSGSHVLYYGAGVRAFTWRDLPGGGHERADRQVSGAAGVMLTA
jgi:hypothetical protein